MSPRVGLSKALMGLSLGRCERCRTTAFSPYRSGFVSYTPRTAVQPLRRLRLRARPTSAPETRRYSLRHDLRRFIKRRLRRYFSLGFNGEAVTTLEQVLAEARRNKRVCPQPRKWQELYDMLPNKRRTGGGWEPAVPLIARSLVGHSCSSEDAASPRHLEWAAEHGCLDEVYSYRRALPESEWHHVGGR